MRAALIASVLALGCGDDAGSPGPEDAAADLPDRDAGHKPTRDPDAGRIAAVITEPEDDAAYIYDQAELRTYELILAPEALAQIDANPLAEEYVSGMLRFEGRDYGPVGVRYKGSVGAFRGCLTDFRGGTKTCTKLSIKVSFNWADPEGRFHGLRKLQFHAMNRDPSMLKERLGYALWREAGIAAPRAVHARLLINGELVGLFALVEQIDGRFTRSRFREGGEGNLYKEAWPLTADNHAVAEAALRMRLQTNEDEMPPLDPMLDFARALEQSDAKGLAGAIAGFTDLDYAMRYVAVDRTIAHDDGPFHWYCGLGSCFNHNYYWYEAVDSDRLWIIAWDMDSAFNLNNLTTTIWLGWDDTSRGCTAMAQPPFSAPLRSPVCDKLILGWAQQQERYLDEVAAFVDGPFAAEPVEDKLSTWEAQIAPVVEEAAAEHGDAPTPEAWADAKAALRAAIAELRERAVARIARGPITVGDPWLVAPPQAGDAGTTDGATTEPDVDAAAPPDAAPDTSDEDAGDDDDAGR